MDSGAKILWTMLAAHERLSLSDFKALESRSFCLNTLYFQVIDVKVGSAQIPNRLSVVENWR